MRRRKYLSTGQKGAAKALNSDPRESIEVRCNAGRELRPCSAFIASNPIADRGPPCPHGVRYFSAANTIESRPSEELKKVNCSAAEISKGRMRTLGPGIFLVSLAVLLIELLLTRIFSVVMFHHFSFLAVSLAMLGLGLGGLLVNLLPSVFRKDNVLTLTPYLCLGLAASLLIAARVAFNTPVLLESNADNWWRVLKIFALTACPMTFGGLIVAQILAFHSEQANRLYFCDLLGAGVACLAMSPLVRHLGAPNALLVAAAIASLAGLVLARAPLTRGLNALAVIGLLIAAFTNAGSPFFDLQYAKGQPIAPALATRWNSFSRVEVRGTPASLAEKRAPLSWGFSSRLSTRVHELHLIYDADAMTQIVGFDGDPKSVEYLLWDVASAAHHISSRTPARSNTDRDATDLSPHESVLVIGAGGGRDVLAAVAAGAAQVTGVEINDVTVDLMRTDFREFTSGLYVDYPGVEIHVEDGRSFVRRETGRYDLIVASLVDTWAASAAGAYALAENSLYTVEAFDDYFEALKPNGMISFSRWYGAPPDEVLRVVSLARKALRARGISDPARHVTIVRTDPRHTHRQSLATILIKKTPFEPEEIDALADWTREMLFLIPYAATFDPDPNGQTPFEALLGTDEQANALIASAPFDLRPTTDNRPFFFDRVPIVGWAAHRIGLPAPPYARQPLPLGSVALLTALCASAAVACVLIGLPLVFSGRRKGSEIMATLARAERLRWVGFFAALGLGYIIVEIVMIQRFNLYLGNPAFALAVVLFTMLASSSVGALLASRLETRTALVRTMGAVCLAIAYVALSLDAFVQLTMSGGIASRILAVVVYVAPVGCLMGMPFPTGLRFAGRISPELVSWAWAVNGGMSVLGSVLAVLISMSIGFSACLLVGMATYALGAVMLSGAPTEVESAVTARAS